MGGFSIWHIILLALVLGLFIYPISKILGRAGWNPWLALLWLIPVLNIVMLWALRWAIGLHYQIVRRASTGDGGGGAAK